MLCIYTADAGLQAALTLVQHFEAAAVAWNQELNTHQPNEALRWSSIDTSLHVRETFTGFDSGCCLASMSASLG